MRLATPHHRLLQEAADQIVDPSRRHPPVTWTVGQRVDRPGSTVFPITFIHGQRRVAAFFKTLHVPPEDPRLERRLQRRRDELSLTSESTKRVSRALADLPIHVQTPLAIDPDTQSIISLAVPGKPIGLAIRHASPSHRRRARYLWALLGTGLRRWEDATTTAIDDDHQQLVIDAFEGVLQRAPARLDVSSVNHYRRIAHTLVEGLPQHCAVIAHGDVNNTNILVAGNAIGLIDTSWTIKPAGFDLAFYISHLELELPRLPSWTHQLIRSLVVGYGLHCSSRAGIWDAARFLQLLRLRLYGSYRAKCFAERRLLTNSWNKMSPDI